jgi:serine/threonine protein kinase
MCSIHRDLKPENLLLTCKGDSAQVKLIDFGLAKLISTGQGTGAATSFLGTKGYLAPEMLQRLAYDKSVDIWVRFPANIFLCGRLSQRAPYFWAVC